MCSILMGNSGFNFICDNCGKVHQNQEILASFALYGAVFLFGYDYGYYGVNCPQCSFLSLYKIHLSELETIRGFVRGQFEGDNQAYTPVFKYFAFPYSQRFLSLKQSIGFEQVYSSLPIGEEGIITLSRDDFKTMFFNDGYDWPDGYCTYSFADQSYGTNLAIWWFSEREIQKAIDRENKTKLRVFPRYRLSDPLLENVCNFAWQYILTTTETDPFTGLPYNEQFSYDDLNQYFINLVTLLPRSWAGAIPNWFKKLVSIYPNDGLTLVREQLDCCQSEKATSIHSQMAILILDYQGYRELLDKSSFLREPFIKDFFEIVCRSVFRPTDILNLKIKYLELFYGLLFNKEFTQKIEEIPGDKLLTQEEKTQNILEFFIEKSTSNKNIIAVNNLKSLNKEMGGENTIFKDRENIEALKQRVEEYETLYPALKQIITINPELMKLKIKLIDYAQDHSNILILGETGVGKSLFAKAIYQASKRKGPYQNVNCGTLKSKDLIASELFGHVRGSHSTAVSDRAGYFRYCNDGVLFLDEIAELPMDIQAVLLTVVEEKSIIPVGSDKSFPVDVKLVFATNNNLLEQIEINQFREDLYYRIAESVLRIPPLRERPEDIPLLVDHFVEEFNNVNKKEINIFPSSVLEMLKNYSWKGNVRDLRSVIGKIVNLSEEDEIHDELGKYLVQNDTYVQQNETAPDHGHTDGRYKVSDEEIIYWMKKLGNNKTQVGKKLGVTYNTIKRRWQDILTKLEGNSADT